MDDTTGLCSSIFTDTFLKPRPPLVVQCSPPLGNYVTNEFSCNIKFPGKFSFWNVLSLILAKLLGSGWGCT